MYGDGGRPQAAWHSQRSVRAPGKGNQHPGFGGGPFVLRWSAVELMHNQRTGRGDQKSAWAENFV